MYEVLIYSQICNFLVLSEEICGCISALVILDIVAFKCYLSRVPDVQPWWGTPEEVLLRVITPCQHATSLYYVT